MQAWGTEESTARFARRARGAPRSGATSAGWTCRGRAAAFARFIRETILNYGLGPMMDVYVRARAIGSNRFDALKPPVVFVANHSSHLDTPTILRSLPRKWRQRTAVAAAADYFYKNRARRPRGLADLQHRADLASRRRPRQGRDRPRRAPARPALEPPALPRGHALARRPDRPAALGRGRHRRRARPDDRADLRRRHARRDAAGPRLAEAQAGPLRSRAATRSRCASATPIVPAPGEHRGETMERVRAFMEQQSGQRPITSAQLDAAVADR